MTNILNKFAYFGKKRNEGFNGKKVLIFSFHDEDKNSKVPLNDSSFNRFANHIKKLFNLKLITDFTDRITYVNLWNVCNENRTVKHDDIENFIKDDKIDPDIIIVCGVDLREAIFKPNNFIKDDYLVKINIDDVKNENEKYLYKKEINGKVHLILNIYSLAYNFGEKNTLDGNKLDVFMKICFNEKIYDEIIKDNSNKETIIIKIKDNSTINKATL